ncbi:T9SS type A sorting domain-containing protein [Neolewinella litorea]|uniref:T9SS type A sorting domain-containing protein n=1 Tax=Neolewinella litorea TaxID=2562452 RepID=A0A4S4NNW6_9BACT|nr:T9SS type A sorting domain-containing protein [Neolewinella litorea]THH40725.1 T9SS type A sorting domain-containing protein [Neolewinella litorea]
MYPLSLSLRLALVGLFLFSLTPESQAQIAFDLGDGRPGGISASSVVGESIYRGGIAGGDDSEIVSEASLPAVLTYFGVTNRGGAVEAAWETTHEENLNRYVVEYSPDGVSFAALAERLPLTGPLTANRHYRIELPLPEGAEAYYRLRTVEADGSFSLSALERMVFERAGWSFTILANPVLDHKLGISVAGAAGDLTLQVFSLDGREQLRRSLGPSGNGIYRTALRLPPGVYIVTLDGQDGGRQSQRVVVGR